MRILFIILFILPPFTTFAQQGVKKALLFVDGQQTTYTEYKKLDLTKFAEISVLAEKRRAIQLFGKRAKHGVLHLRTTEFNDRQKRLISDLKAEFNENRVESSMFVVNGVPYDRNQFEKDILNKIEYRTVEWIALPERTDTMNNKRVIIIQTNIVI